MFNDLDQTLCVALSGKVETHNIREGNGISELYNRTCLHTCSQKGSMSISCVTLVGRVGTRNIGRVCIHVVDKAVCQCYV